MKAPQPFSQLQYQLAVDRFYRQYFRLLNWILGLLALDIGLIGLAVGLERAFPLLLGVGFLGFLFIVYRMTKDRLKPLLVSALLFEQKQAQSNQHDLMQHFLQTSQQEATLQQLQKLLDSGELTADPKLFETLDFSLKGQGRSSLLLKLLILSLMLGQLMAAFLLTGLGHWSW